MEKIISPLKPEEDELMISYLYRLAEENRMSFAQFLHWYIYPNTDTYRKGKQLIKNDANSAFHGFFEAEANPIDKIDFYLSHSIYGGIVPAMTSGQQMQMVNEAFRPGDLFPRLNTKLNSTIPELKYCPRCAAEDRADKGYTWFRRTHNMPGVNICLKHRCALKVNHFKSYVRLFEKDTDDTEAGFTNLDWEYKYAVFAKNLLHENIDTDLRSFADAALEEIRGQGLSGNQYQKLKETVQENGISQLAGIDIRHFIKIDLVSGVYVNKAAAIALALAVFGSIKTLEKHIRRNKGLTSRFLEEAENGYDIFQPFRNTILEMRRIDTGERFITTGYGFISGWREYSADYGRTEEDKFVQLFQNVTDGTYEMLTPFSGMTERLTIRHNKCGKIITPRARSFLIDGGRCSCENEITFDDAAGMIKALGAFTLSEYSRTEKSCAIRHDICGNIFKPDRFRNFLRHPFCPVCEGMQRYNEEDYKDAVRALVGDEYTVIGYPNSSTDKAMILHEKCGRSSEYQADRFLTGQRCRYCARIYKEADFRALVGELSLGRYKVGQRIHPKNSMYEITDITTGESRILDSLYVLQELRRPKPSRVLPLDRKGKDFTPATIKDRVLSVIHEKYTEDDLIFPEDIVIPGVQGKAVYARMRELATDGELYSIGTGSISVYALKETTLTPEKYIAEYYLARRGHTIGIQTGESLLYEMGIIHEKPETWHILTNKVSSAASSRRTEVMGMELMLYGTRIMVMDGNAETLKVLEAIKSNYHAARIIEPALKRYIIEHTIHFNGVQQYLPYYSGYVRKRTYQLFEEI